MANPKGTIKNLMPPIKPGEVRNPTGRPKIPAALKELKRMSRLDFELKVTKYMNATMTDLKDVVLNPQTGAVDRILAQSYLDMAKHGDRARLEYDLNRILGKVKEEVEISHPKPVVIVRPNGDHVVLKNEDESDK